MAEAASSSAHSRHGHHGRDDTRRSDTPRVPAGYTRRSEARPDLRVPSAVALVTANHRSVRECE